MSDVTMAPSRVRHHFLMVDVSVGTLVAFAEMLNAPSTLPLLGVFQATDGVPRCTLSVSVVLVVVLFVVSVMVMTNVCVPNDHVVESNENIALVRFLLLLLQHPVVLSKVP